MQEKLVEKSVSDLENLLIQSQVANCDNLIALFTPRYEADPQNLDLAKNIVKMMTVTEGCTDNNLFLNAVTVMYNQEPSHTSAYYLYKLYAGRNDVEKAIAYMDEAVNYEESDNATDASYLYELATFCIKNGNNAKAVEAANKAIEISDLVDGKAYMLLGTIWGSVVCQGNEIEQRAKYWVATDYMQKAKNADPALTEDCNNYINQFRVYYPQTAEAFMYDITNGQS